VKAPTKPSTGARRLADCGPGDVAQTPAGCLLVTGNINGWPLCRLYHPDEERVLTQPFGAPPDLAVLTVRRKPMPPSVMAGGSDYDPLRGREIA
jgi:hypothetical protein